MKKWLPLILLLLCSVSFAKELCTTKAVRLAIMAGAQPHLVIDWLKCTQITHNIHQGQNSEAVTPTDWLLTTDNVASLSKQFTLFNAAFPEKPLYEISHYVLTEDNKMNILIQLLDASNYMLLSGDTEFDCPLRTGVRVFT